MKTKALLTTFLNILTACLAFTNYNMVLTFSKTLQKPTSLNYHMNVNPDDNMSYLDRLENKNLTPPSRLNNQQKQIRKLKSIQNNITKYIDKKNKTPECQAFATRYNNPIQRTDFDNIFLNINNISAIYLSSDYDRAIFQFSDNRKYVFYISNKNEKSLIEKIINIIQQHPIQQVKIIIVCDKSSMTDPFGYLYCQS
jgi:hypothetical protein